MIVTYTRRGLPPVKVLIGDDKDWAAVCNWISDRLHPGVPFEPVPEKVEIVKPERKRRRKYA